MGLKPGLFASFHYLERCKSYYWEKCLLLHKFWIQVFFQCTVWCGKASFVSAAMTWQCQNSRWYQPNIITLLQNAPVADLAQGAKLLVWCMKSQKLISKAMYSSTKIQVQVMNSVLMQRHRCLLTRSIWDDTGGQALVLNSPKMTAKLEQRRTRES